MRVVPLLAVLPLCACHTVFTLDDPLACGADWLELDAGLTTHLAHGDPADGTFDYDPERALVAHTVGSYDLASGGFDWVSTFDDGYWIVSEKVTDGVGTAFVDGDVDIAYTRQVTDLSGAQPAEKVREVRLGCDVERDVTNLKDAPQYTERGAFGEDGYVYTRTRERDGALIETEGTLGPDFTRTEHEAWRIGDLQYEEDVLTSPDGKLVRTYDRLDADEHEYGQERVRVDGTRTFAYTVETFAIDAAWSYSKDLDGDGSGEVEFTPRNGNAYTCDVRWRKGECTVQCDGAAAEGC